MEMENNTQVSAPANKSNKKKFIAIAIAAAAVLGAGSYFLPDNFNVWRKFNISTGGNAAAVVNGEKITKSDLDLRIDRAKEAIQLQGVNLADEKALAEIKKQMLNDMINEKILLQNAVKSGISVNDADVKTAYDQLIAKFKSKEDFAKELASRKISEKEVREGIAKQMTLNKYVAQNVDLKSVGATDEEVGNLYKKYSGQQKNMPKIEEIKAQLANEVKQQKSRATVLEFIEKLKKDASIKIFL